MKKTFGFIALAFILQSQTNEPPFNVIVHSDHVEVRSFEDTKNGNVCYVAVSTNMYAPQRGANSIYCMETYAQSAMRGRTR